MRESFKRGRFHIDNGTLYIDRLRACVAVSDRDWHDLLALATAAIGEEPSGCGDASVALSTGDVLGERICEHEAKLTDLASRVEALGGEVKSLNAGLDGEKRLANSFARHTARDIARQTERVDRVVAVFRAMDKPARPSPEPGGWPITAVDDAIDALLAAEDTPDAQP